MAASLPDHGAGSVDSGARRSTRAAASVAAARIANPIDPLAPRRPSASANINQNPSEHRSSTVEIEPQHHDPRTRSPTHPDHNTTTTVTSPRRSTRASLRSNSSAIPADPVVANRNVPRDSSNSNSNSTNVLDQDNITSPIRLTRAQIRANARASKQQSTPPSKDIPSEMTLDRHQQRSSSRDRGRDRVNHTIATEINEDESTIAEDATSTRPLRSTRRVIDSRRHRNDLSGISNGLDDDDHHPGNDNDDDDDDVDMDGDADNYRRSRRKRSPARGRGLERASSADATRATRATTTTTTDGGDSMDVITDIGGIGASGTATTTAVSTPPRQRHKTFKFECVSPLLLDALAALPPPPVADGSTSTSPTNKINHRIVTHHIHGDTDDDSDHVPDPIAQLAFARPLSTGDGQPAEIESILQQQYMQQKTIFEAQQQHLIQQQQRLQQQQLQGFGLPAAGLPSVQHEQLLMQRQQQLLRQMQQQQQFQQQYQQQLHQHMGEQEAVREVEAAFVSMQGALSVRQVSYITKLLQLEDAGYVMSMQEIQSLAAEQRSLKLAPEDLDPCPGYENRVRKRGRPRKEDAVRSSAQAVEIMINALSKDVMEKYDLQLRTQEDIMRRKNMQQQQVSQQSQMQAQRQFLQTQGLLGPTEFAGNGLPPAFNLLQDNVSVPPTVGSTVDVVGTSSLPVLTNDSGVVPGIDSNSHVNGVSHSNGSILGTNVTSTMETNGNVFDLHNQVNHLPPMVDNYLGDHADDDDDDDEIALSDMNDDDCPRRPSIAPIAIIDEEALIRNMKALKKNHRKARTTTSTFLSNIKEEELFCEDDPDKPEAIYTNVALSKYDKRMLDVHDTRPVERDRSMFLAVLEKAKLDHWKNELKSQQSIDDSTAGQSTANSSINSPDASESVGGGNRMSLTQKPSKSRQIQFGKFRINTWYIAPYPEEYNKQPLLYICDRCFKYIRSEMVWRRHMLKCPVMCPPGNEIYRKGKISVFEVDGKVSKAYCQNICLLAKMFLDHKVLYYDVEPFVFYIMMERQPKTGKYSFVGYFSKEKQSSGNYNLSCIMTLPIHQRKGYGNFLIEFSYALTKLEGKLGSPEKPLSGLGLVSYRNYWRLAVCRALYELEKTHGSNVDEISIPVLSNLTGMTHTDVIHALHQMGMLVRARDVQTGTESYVMKYPKELIHSLVEKADSKGYPRVDTNCIRWSPSLYHADAHMTDN